ncbi:hypothetical protein U1Q18_010179 [Sarracenia purpurea var. burkii]
MIFNPPRSWKMQSKAPNDAERRTLTATLIPDLRLPPPRFCRFISPTGHGSVLSTCRLRFFIDSSPCASAILLHLPAPRRFCDSADSSSPRLL